MLLLLLCYRKGRSASVYAGSPRALRVCVYCAWATPRLWAETVILHITSPRSRGCCQSGHMGLTEQQYRHTDSCDRKLVVIGQAVKYALWRMRPARYTVSAPVQLAPAACTWSTHPMVRFQSAGQADHLTRTPDWDRVAGPAALRYAE